MEKKINNILLFTGKDGTQMTFRVLFTYYSETFKKDYAVFYNEADEEQLIAYSFNEDNVLSALESDEEYKELEQALRKFDEEQSEE